MEQENINTSSKSTTFGAALSNAGVTSDDFPLGEEDRVEPKGKIVHNNIINNTGSNKITRSRITDYQRLINEIITELKTIELYLTDIDRRDPENFCSIYREREGKHPITMDSEIRHRLDVARSTVRKISPLFVLEQMEYSKTD